MIAVLAGTYQEFCEYADQNKGKKLVFCDKWPNFVGLKFSEYVEIGTFRLRPDALDLYQRVMPMVTWRSDT